MLREASGEGVTLRALGAALREGFVDGDLAWIEGVVRSLEKDGLAVVDGALPAPVLADAVAEERPAYGAEGTTGTLEPVATRVRLP